MDEATLYPGLLVSIEYQDGRTEYIYHVDSVAIHDGRIRIWFLNQDSEGCHLELDATNVKRYDISLNTGDE